MADPRVEITGYFAVFEAPHLGPFSFNHHKCGSTIAVKAEDFIDMYHGEVYQERKTGGPDCPGYCLNSAELRPCAAKCECAFVREVVQIVKTWPKKAGDA
jgi:hypothetical protein